MAQAAPVLAEDMPPPMTDSANLDEYPAPPPRVPRGKTNGTKRFGPNRETEDQKESFWEYLNGLSATDWESHMLYVYMWDPIVDLTKGGREAKYRKRYTSTINEESLKRDIGSGTYNLKLNKLESSSPRRERTIKEVVINIFDPDYPPNLPPGGWMDDPRNKEWAWAKPLLEKKWAVPSPAAVEGVPPYMVQFMNEIRNEVNRRSDLNPSAKDQLMSSVVTILPALLQQQNNANDPAKVIEAMSKMRELFAPAAPAQDNTMLTFLLAELKSSREQQTLLMTKLFEMKSESVKQPDPLSQVKTMAELITLVSGIVQPAAPKEPWQDVVESLGPEVLKTAQSIAGAFAMGQRPAPRPQPQPNPAQVINVQPQVQPQPVQAQPVQAQPVQTQPEPAQPAQPEMDTQTRSMVYQVAVLATNALNLGMEGGQFADQVCYKFSQAVYDKFIGSVAKEALLDRFKSVPEAWHLLQAFEGELPAFIDSFYAYATEPDEDDPKNISEPVEVVKPKKVAKKKG
jgi:hypothetical protein